MITTTSTSAACLDPVASYYAFFPGVPPLAWQQKNDLNYSSQLCRKRRHSIFTSTLLDHSWIPSYLYQTHYASLVREQHQALIQKRNVNDKKLAYDTLHQYASINLDSSNRLATLDLRLPSFMSSTDKSRYLDIDLNGLGVNYVGPGRSEDHAGTVRANLPIPIQCGVYYYEMHVKSKGDDGYIGIGFCSGRNELKRLPGWDKLSFGYHGDDGHKFEGSGIGKKYGPQFQSGDVVGCGLDFANQCAFYTKNGAFLGVAFQHLDLSIPMFPCIGMRTHGEYVTINFGQQPFVYDIIQYIQEQKMALWKDISSHSIPTSATLTTSPASNSIDQTVAAEYSNNTSPSMDQLILSYMIHHGYSDSAAALKKNSVYLSDPDTIADRGLLQRLAVKKAIGRGAMDDAIELVRLHFPALISSDKDSILFRLKCQKFIEMVGEDDAPDNTGHGSTNDSRTKQVSTTRTGTATDDMDLDDETSTASPEYQRLQSIMSFGQELQDEYGKEASPTVMDKLKQVFSLLAYPDPSSSPVGYLLSKTNREALASDVNAAILVHQNQPEMSPLDCVYRQLLAVNRELTYLGHGHSAFLDLSQE